MAADEKWYFTKEQLQSTPSRKCGFEADKELSYRQQAANFIQDMGQKLQVSQLCINTAIVYMHRFYMFHSFSHFSWNTMAAAAFFLAAKVEEQPRKLEHVIRVANICLHRGLDQQTAFDAKSEQYAAQSQDLVFNENVLLQTLGFDVAIDHPHTHVVRCCHLVRASKDLAQTSYFMASNSLHLTTMCLQYKPTVVACFCIHLACKWSNWQIPKSNEGKDWFNYVDKSVTSELLEQLTTEFLVIFDKCPSRLKRKIMSLSNNPHAGMEQPPHSLNTNSNSPFDAEPKKTYPTEKDGMNLHLRVIHEAKQGVLNAVDDQHKKQRPHDPSSSQQRIEYRDYRDREREKKAERERQEREKQHHTKPGVPSASKHMLPGSQPSKPPHSHHRPVPGVDPKHPQKLHHRPGSQLPEQVREPGTTNPAAVNRDYGRETNGRETLNVHHRDVINRDVHREQIKEVQKHVRAELTSKVDSEFSNKIDSGEKQRYDTNRQKVVDPKLLAKHDPNRHKYPKRPETVPNISEKKVVPAQSAQENKNSFINKQTNSTTQRHRSPFSDAPKSVPLLQTPTSTTYLVKSETRNGNHSSNSLPTIAVDKQPWPESTISDDPGLVSPLPKQRQPSLFSPEKTSPPKKNSTKTPPSLKKNSDVQLANSSMPNVVSPFSSPPPKLTPGQINKRHRSSSSSSEPELRPVVKKLDQISGFENIIRDSKMGIKLPKVPDIIQPICDRSSEIPTETSISKELKPPEIIKPFSNSSTDIKTLSQPIVNGLETDPTLISNLLKEVPAQTTTTLNHLPVIKKESPRSPEYPHLPVPQPVAAAAVPSVATSVTITLPPAAEVPVEKHKSEHHHKSEKKKKKDKHKHKDKEKSKEEKEKKKKHKDRDKEKHKVKTEKIEEQSLPEPPLKITIPKDKIIQPPPEPQSTGLKVKISKDRLKTDSIAENTGGLKLKISKDKLQYNSVTEVSRKREREKTSPVVGPPAKAAKTNYTRNSDTRQNGRNTYSKVSYNSRGRYGNNMPARMPPPQVFQPNQPPPFFVPNYPPPNVQMAQAWYPADALYHPQFYGYQMYPPPDMYSVPPQTHDFQIQSSSNPPLPEGPPPNTPPPPPPE